MAYSINPNLPKARAFAMKLLIAERLPLQVVANRCGIHRSTVWRWKRKWDYIKKSTLRNTVADTPRDIAKVLSSIRRGALSRFKNSPPHYGK